MYLDLLQALEIKEIKLYNMAFIAVDDIESESAIYKRIGPRHYITINSAYTKALIQKPIETSYILADIIAHEIIHQCCNINGVRDIDKIRPDYHTYIFRNVATKNGLYTGDRVAYKGYCITTLPIQIYRRIISHEHIKAILEKYATMQAYYDF